jgi:hypothetical protein
VLKYPWDGPLLIWFPENHLHSPPNSCAYEDAFMVLYSLGTHIPSESNIPRIVVLTRAASSSTIKTKSSPLMSFTFPGGTTVVGSDFSSIL